MISRFYYDESNNIYFVENNENDLKTITLKEKCAKPGIDEPVIRYWEIQKEYTNDLKGLLQYREDFNNWDNEIKSYIDYSKYYNHDSAVQLVFKRYSTRDLAKFQFTPITFKECLYLEKCFNAGIMTFDKTYAEKTINSYGYDYSGYYPNLLSNSDFKFPMSEGKRHKKKKLDYDNLDYGIYRVKITSDDNDFKKIFNFSKDHYYTHYCLQFVAQNKNKFNVEMELIIDDDYNSIIWKPEQLVNSYEIFGNWYNNLSKLKTKYPKNKLVKKLTSSLWGYITKFERYFFDEDDFYELDVSRMNKPDKTEYKLIQYKTYKDETKQKGIRDVYEVFKIEKPYKTNLARLKPFLTSYARTYIGRVIINENIISDVIRTQTDNITLSKPHDFTHLKYYPKPEDKTTGNILWNNINNYSKTD